MISFRTVFEYAQNKASRERPTRTIDPSGDAFRAMHHSSYRVIYGLSYEEAGGRYGDRKSVV